MMLSLDHLLGSLNRRFWHACVGRHRHDDAHLIAFPGKVIF